MRSTLGRLEGKRFQLSRQRISRKAAMKIPVDKLNIIVRHDGWVLAKHARGAVLEQLVRPGMAGAILRVLEAEGHLRKGQRHSAQGVRVVHPISRRAAQSLRAAGRSPDLPMEGSYDENQ